MFIWKVKAARAVEIGGEAGTPTPQGYRTIGIAGKRYMAHRLAWMYVHGRWPDGEIDHINGNGRDNRIANLRDVPPQVNKQNIRRANRDNKSGFLGVSPNGRRWSAQLAFNGRKIHLGTFDTPEEAHTVYLSAKRSTHEGCTL